MEKNKSDFSWKTLLSVGGAWAFITPLIPMVFIFIYAVGMFRSGMLQSFENPSDAYAWYCGKWVSEFMDISASS